MMAARFRAMLPAILVVMLLAVLLTAPPVAARAQAPDPFAACEEQLEAAPVARSSAACFYQQARRTGAWEETARRLGAHISEPSPAAGSRPWLLFYQANTLWPTGAAQVPDLYRAAAQQFEEQALPSGQVLALVNLAIYLGGTGRLTEAGESLRRAEIAAAASADPLDGATVQLQMAHHLQETGGDLDEVAHRLERVEAVVFAIHPPPEGALSLQRGCLAGLWRVSYDLGRFFDARRYAERWLELAQSREDLYGRASALYAGAITATELELPSAAHRARARNRFRQAAAVAAGAGHATVEARSRLLLAKLGGRADPELEEELRRCLELAHQAGLDQVAADCRREQVRRTGSPELARRALQEAGATTALGGAYATPWTPLYDWADHLELLWRGEPQETALAGSLDVLDAIEDLRSAQRRTGGAHFLSVWSDAYYWLSGRLLTSTEALEEGPRRALQERSFEVIERLRAQVLREHLAATNITPGRQATAPGPAGLEAVQQALAPEEALLSYQVFLWKSFYDRFAGGAWLTVVTRDSVRVHRLPDRLELEPALEIFLGLREPDGAPQAVSALHRQLLAPALKGLPEEVERLILIPDGPLHLLPFAALRENGGEPLASQYELSSAPSASLWLHWRRASQESPPAAGGALILAVPDADTSLASLPHARREGRAVRGLTGRSSRLLLGPEATAEALRETPSSRYRILHLAAHAIVDEKQPDRSAVVLAGGQRLEAAEIAHLDLAGKVVVLSACRSASGRWLRGEGVLSLARAFFEAGAHAVVGTLTPVRDDHAADLVQDLYRGLARGATLQGALAAAQRRRIEAGAPSRTWSSLVVLGNGRLVPLPRSIPDRGGFRAALWLLLGLLPALWLLLSSRRRQRKVQ